MWILLIDMFRPPYFFLVMYGNHLQSGVLMTDSDDLSSPQPKYQSRFQAYMFVKYLNNFEGLHIDVHKLVYIWMFVN